MRTDDEQKLREHAISARGAYRCWRCGHKLSQDGNMMMGETGLRDPEAEADDDAMGLELSCPHCGATYECYDTPQSERGDFPYFQEGSDGDPGPEGR